jgi:asparagine synthase (glutamine-hydrolysing)
MCGISGFFINASNYDSADELIQSMCASLGHRGPDGWGTYICQEMAIGHTRLSIVDLAGGMQPMMSERYVIAFNGEIFNYIELRQEMIKKEVSFKTHSDTEVALKAFETYGFDAFSMFNGQFAMIIWDRNEKRAIVVRDRFGVRPLYVLNYHGSFYFASEMKAFDAINGFRRKMDIQNLLVHGLLWNTVDDATVYENIRSVPEGRYEIYSPGKRHLSKRYYEIGESRPATVPTYGEAKEEFSTLLKDSVRLRLRSDVPVGAYLSGGIDSSIISYLVALEKKDKFKSFSVAFKDRQYDESSYQHEMVKHLNTEHYSQAIHYKDIESNFLESIYHTERPIFRTAPVPLYLLSKKVRDINIKVVLTGEGADEVLYGYDSFKELKLLAFWNKNIQSKLRPQLIKKLYPHLRHYNNPEQFGLVKMFYQNFLPVYNDELAGLNIRIHNNRVLANLFNKDHQIAFDIESLKEKVKTILPEDFDSWSILQKNQFLEMKNLLAGYLLSSQGDRMSMAHSVEGRYPFLDHRLVEYLFHLPDSYKLNGFSQKYLLTDTYQKLIPTSIINRPKRPYMAPDLKSFFQDGTLAEQAAYFLSDKMIDSYGIFNKKYVNRFIKKFSGSNVQEIGYRDNMLITFMLSTQMACFWSENPKKYKSNKDLRQVDIVDNKE